MSAKGRQWVSKELRLTEVRTRKEFQFRANGLERKHVAKLRGALEDGKPLPRVKIAQVGQALYLVDGYHRLEAHKLAKRDTIAAAVARMSLGEAREAAKLANTTHGLGLSNADKRLIWEQHVAAGAHRDAEGALKTPRAIRSELNYQISREYIRKKLIEMGLENELVPAKAWDREEVTEEMLAEERRDAAEADLKSFGDLFPTLTAEDRQDLLKAARAMLDQLERGETPELVIPMADRLGI